MIQVAVLLLPHPHNPVPCRHWHRAEMHECTSREAQRGVRIDLSHHHRRHVKHDNGSFLERSVFSSTATTARITLCVSHTHTPSSVRQPNIFIIAYRPNTHKH